MKKRIWMIVLGVLLMIGGFVFVYYLVSQSEVPLKETESKEESNIEKENTEEPIGGEEESIMNEEFVSKINLVIQGEGFTATLEDNETSRAFISQLPLTITMNELNGNEKYYYLDESLPSQATSVSQIETGDLMLYGDDCLVLFYDTFKTSYRYTRIGKLDQIDQLKELVGNGTIEVSVSK